MRIDVGVSAAISDLTITGGKAPITGSANNQKGGGILTTGNLVLASVNVVDNEADNNASINDDGGGIATIGGTLTVVDSTFRGNTSGHWGGAIYASNATVRIEGSSLEENTATDVNGNGFGGAVYATGGAVDIIDSDFEGNKANSGGAVFASFASVGTYKLRDSRLQNNHASQHGGAIYYEGANGGSGTLQIDSSTIEQNTAGQTGGGLSYRDGSIVIAASTFLENSAEVRGGAIASRGTRNASLLLTNSTLSQNVAPSGGGIHIERLNLVNVHGSTIAENRATSSSELGGGGISKTNTDARVILHNSIVAENTSAKANTANIAGLLSTTDAQSSSYNVVGSSGHGNLSQASPNWNIVLPLGQNAGLSRLGYYGGPTETYALLPGSPAIDKGNPNAVEGTGGVGITDQRGFDRITNGDGTVGERVDVGAVEMSPIVVEKVDFNGDGRDDFATYDELSGSLVVFVTLDSGTGGGHWATLDASVEWDWQQYQIGDFDGNGRDDLLVRDEDSGKWKLLLSEGTKFSAYDSGLTGTWAQRIVGDFNGDRRDDILLRNGEGNWTLARSETTLFHVDALGIGAGDWTKTYVGDFDGDGSDELLGRIGTAANWSVLRYSDSFRGQLESIQWSTGGATIAANAANVLVHVGDTNRDMKDDLVVWDGDSWVVGLAQVQGGALQLDQEDWGSWFGAYDSNAHTLDTDAPYQKLIDIYSNIYNTVELELYRGFKKGIEGTKVSKAANSWDQAALLVDQLDAAGFNSRIAIGTVKALTEDVSNWIGAERSFLELPIQDDIVDVLQQTTDPNAVAVGATEVQFNHAWVEVDAPASTGWSTVQLNPSWKFRQLSDRPDNSVLPQEVYELIGGNGPATGAGSVSAMEYLRRTDGKLPLDVYKDTLTSYLNEFHPTLSISDVSFTGPIVTRMFHEFPTELGENVVIVDTGESTTDDVELYDNYNEVASTAATEWVYRVQISFARSSAPSSKILTHIVSIPKSLFDDITISYNGNRPELRIGAETKTATADILPNEYLHLEIVPIVLGTSTPNTDPGYTFKQDIKRHDLTSIVLNANQFSSHTIVDQRSALLSNFSDHRLLSHTVSQYWFQYNAAFDEIAKLALGRSDRRYVGIGTASASPGVGISNVENAPFEKVPEDLYLSIQTYGSVRTWGGTTTYHAHANELLGMQSSALEHIAVEQVAGVEAISTFKALQLAFQRNRGIAANGGQVVDDEVFVLRRNPNSTNAVRTGSGYAGGATPFVPLSPQELLPGLSEIAALLINHFVNGTNQIALEVHNFLFPVGGLTQPVVVYVPKYRSHLGSWTGSVAYMQTLSPVGDNLAAIFIPDDGPVLNGAAAGSPIQPGAIAPPSTTHYETYAGDPVNVANGNMFREETDILFPNIGVPMDFGRRYNSQSTVKVGTKDVTLDIGLGVGWTHSFSDRLHFVSNSQDSSNPNLVWISSTGERHTFTYTPLVGVTPAHYKSSSELKGTLSLISGNVFVYRDRDGMEYHFEKAVLGSSPDEGEAFARLVKKVDLNNNGFMVTYASPANSGIPSAYQITTVHDVHTSNRKLEFTYNGVRIEGIRKHYVNSDASLNSSLLWKYSYAPSGPATGQLTSVESPPVAFGLLPSTVSYSYYGQDTGDSQNLHGLMKRITEPNGDYHEYKYYHNKRVFRVDTSVDLKSLTDPLDDTKVSHSYTYNLAANTTEFTDELGNVETYVYQRNGLLVRQVHADGTRQEYTWGAIGGSEEFLMKSTRDEVGAVETFEYYTSANGGGTGNEFKIGELYRSTAKHFVDSTGTPTDPGNLLVTQYDYQRATNKQHIIKLSQIIVDPSDENITTTFSYNNSSGRLEYVDDPLLNRTTYAYYSDAHTTPHLAGLLQYQTSPKGQGTPATDFRTEFVYDISGNVTTATTDQLPTSTREYDHNGLPTRIVDATGVVSVNAYDVLGRLRSSGVGSGNGIADALVSTYQYDAAGQLASTVDPLGRIVELSYDSRGKQLRRENADGTFVEFEYDALGNLISKTDELGRATRFFYDNRNRLIQTIHPDGASERIRYDGTGRIAATFDASGNTTRFEYDAAGRLISTINAKVDEASNTYDKLGNLRETTDFEGNLTKFEYDDLGRVIKTEVPGEGSNPILLTTTEYDENGNVKRTATYDAEKLDALGSLPSTVAELIALLDSTVPAEREQFHSVEYQYDVFDRLTTRTYVDAGNITDNVASNDDTSQHTVYDDAGRIKYTIDELGRQTEFVYDVYGRLSKTILPAPSVGADRPATAYQYDDIGNLTAITDANGHVTKSDYDAFNRVAGTMNAEGHSSRRIFDAAGQVIASVNALGRAVHTTYDDRGRVKTQHLADPDGIGGLLAPVTEYSYDPAGNVETIDTPDGHSQSFVYDELNRVKESTVTQVHLADQASIDVLSGNPNPVKHADGSFGRDHMLIAGGVGQSPSAKWTFGDLDAGTYRIAITWHNSPSTTVQAQVSYGVEGSLTSLSPEPILQSNAPNEIYFDDQGERRGWIHLETVTVGADGVIEVKLTGPTGTTIQADAVMLLRDVSQSYTYDKNGRVDFVTDELGRIVDYDYDNLGRLIGTTLPDPDDGDSLVAPETTISYDGYGNVAAVTEKRGLSNTDDRTTSRQYDKRNRLVSETVDAGVGGQFENLVTTYQYDLVGNVTNITDPLTNQVHFRYDDLGRLVDEYRNFQEGATAPISLIGNFNKIAGHTGDGIIAPDDKSIELDGNAWGYASIASYQVTHQTVLEFELTIDDLADRIAIGFDTTSGSTAGDIEDFRMFELGGSLATLTAYHQDFRITKLADGKVQVHIPIGQYLTDGEKATGLSISQLVFASLNGVGQTGTSTFANLRLYDSDEVRTVYTYDAVGNVATARTASDPRNIITKFEYDGLNRQTDRYADFGGQMERHSSTTYDAVGNVIATTDVTAGTTTTYGYDRLNRLIATTLPDPDGDTNTANELITTYGYDILGNLTRQSNNVPNAMAAGLQSTFTFYDTVGSPVLEWDGNGDGTRYQYDVVGNLKVVMDARGYQTTYSYDKLDRLSKESNSFGDREFDYNDTGNLFSIEDRNDKVREFTYDRLDRRTKEEWKTVANTTTTRVLEWEYDDLGRVTREFDRGANLATNTAGTYDDIVNTYEYDGLGRLTQQANYDPDPNEIDRGKDNGIPRLKSTYVYQFVFSTEFVDTVVREQFVRPSTVDVAVATTAFEFDRLGRQSALDDSDSSSSSTTPLVAAKELHFGYDLAGNLNSISRQSGGASPVVSTSFAYDDANRLSTITHDLATDIVHSFTYDNASRVYTFDTTGIGADTRIYRYDDAGQLKERGGEPSPNGELYTYDANGYPIVSAYTYVSPQPFDLFGMANRLLADVLFTYDYDDEGNLESRTSNSNANLTTEYKYDHRNRLVSIIDRDGSTITQQIDYQYDVAGRRIVRSLDANGGSTLVFVDEYFAYEGDELAMRFNGDKALTHRYLYGPQLDQVLVDEVFTAGTGGQRVIDDVLWQLADHQGTIRDIVDETAAARKHVDYYSFGEIKDETGAVEQLFYFTGREWDADAKLQNNRARWYDSSTGRFITEDPIGVNSGDPNLYRYAGNDPVNFRDPSGLTQAGNPVENVVRRLPAVSDTFHRLPPVSDGIRRLPPVDGLIRRLPPTGGDYRRLPPVGGGPQAYLTGEVLSPGRSRTAEEFRRQYSSESIDAGHPFARANANLGEALGIFETVSQYLAYRDEYAQYGFDNEVAPALRAELDEYLLLSRLDAGEIIVSPRVQGTVSVIGSLELLIAAGAVSTRSPATGVLLAVAALNELHQGIHQLSTNDYQDSLLYSALEPAVGPRYAVAGEILFGFAAGDFNPQDELQRAIQRLPSHLRTKLRKIETFSRVGEFKSVESGIRHDSQVTGRVTQYEAQQLAEAFVGPNYKAVPSDKFGYELYSADGLRHVRGPSLKQTEKFRNVHPQTLQPYSNTGYQINFESRLQPMGAYNSNVHLDVSAN